MYNLHLYPDQLLSAGNLRVSEMQINPLNPNSGTIFSKGEWFEIYNTTSNLVNLNGLVVSDYLSQSFTVSSDVYVEANGYVTLGLSNDQTNNGGVSHDYVYDLISIWKCRCCRSYVFHRNRT